MPTELEKIIEEMEEMEEMLDGWKSKVKELDTANHHAPFWHLSHTATWTNKMYRDLAPLVERLKALKGEGK